jgi:hypothetical protein
MKRQQRQIDIAEKVRDKRGQPSTHEWNFDKSQVPDEQLVVCCYWEYARESASIRNAVKIAKVAQAEMGIPKPETKEREAFRATVNQAYILLHSTGFDLAFWAGLPFPDAWQSLDKTAREKWAHVCPKIPTPWKIPPFRVTGDLMIASILHGEVRKAHEARQALYLRLSQIDRGVANLEEAADVRNKLSELEKHPTPALLRGIGGVDSFIAQINWREFTDKEIVASFDQWVKAKGNRAVPVTNEPKGVRGMRGGRGQDEQNWRASLDRLGIMRLMHRCSFEELNEIVQAGASEKSADREKYSVKAACKKEWEKAIEDFRSLFTFLPAEEKPLSCEPLPDFW